MFASNYEDAKPPSTVTSGLQQMTSATDDLLVWTQQLLKDAKPPDVVAKAGSAFADMLRGNEPSPGEISTEVVDGAKSGDPSSPLVKPKAKPKSRWLMVQANHRSTIKTMHQAKKLRQNTLRKAIKQVCQMKKVERQIRSSLTGESLKESSDSEASGSEDWSANEHESDEDWTADAPPKNEAKPDAELAEAFKRCAGGNKELNVTQCLFALQLLGHWRPDKDLVEEVFLAMSLTSFVPFLKFGAFVDAYEKKLRESMKSRFMVADTDRSGKISAPEISALLRRQSIVPVPGVVEGLMQDALDKVGRKYHSGVEINFDEFSLMQELMRGRAGFSSKEAEKLLLVFARYDRDRDGKISHAELMAALSWVGSTTDPKVVEGLVNQVDPDASGYLSDYDFLLIMQKVKQIQIKHLTSVFGEMDKDNSGTTDADELEAIFEAMGHTCASPELIAEVMATCGLSEKDELLFEEVYTIMEEARNTEGYLQSELQELTNVFKLYDFEESAELGPVDIYKSMQHMGYPISIEDAVEAFEEFDFDKGGRLDFHEFVKLTSRHRNAEMQSVRNAFRDRNEHFDGQVPLSVLHSILSSLGYLNERWEDLYTGFYEQAYEQACKDSDSKDNAMNSEEVVQVGLWVLVRLVFQFRSERAAKVVDSTFFTVGELAVIRKGYRKHEIKRGRGVPMDHVPALLEELHPKCRHKDEYVDFLLHATELERADDQGNLDHRECLQMIRQAHDQIARDRLDKERQAIQNVKFSDEELREFRRIFRTFDHQADTPGEISLATFAEWISGLVSFEPDVDADRCSEDFSKSVLEPELGLYLASCMEGGNRLDFAEFLLSMRKLWDEDWHGISSSMERAVEMAAEEAKRQQFFSKRACALLRPLQ